MPLPYMGSKRRSASFIKNVIKNYAKEETTIVDLFCGGFAIGESFLKDGYNVIANDKNKYVVALLDQVINKGLDEEKCLEFVSREKFKYILSNKEDYESWYVGYVITLWSFGNNQSDYLLGKDREPIYKKVYDMIVYKKVHDDLKSIIPSKYIEGILKQDDRHKRRMAFKKVWNIIGKSSMQLQSLESLERLQSLESLESLERVEFVSMDYGDVTIPEGSIIYCDPPYSGTAEYAEGGFDSKAFRERAKEKSKTHKVFVSEYNGPSDVKVVYEFAQKSGLGTNGTQSHNNQPTEKVFYLDNTNND